MWMHFSFSFNVFERVISWNSIGWHSPSAWDRIIPKCTYYSFLPLKKIWNISPYLFHACNPGTNSRFQLIHLNVWVIRHLSPRKFSVYLLTFLKKSSPKIFSRKFSPTLFWRFFFFAVCSLIHKMSAIASFRDAYLSKSTLVMTIYNTSYLFHWPIYDSAIY